MTNHRLLQSQRNKAFDLIVECGLDPSQFSWIDEWNKYKDSISRLTYKDGEFFFLFDVRYTQTGELPQSMFSPSNVGRTEELPALNWDVQLNQVRGWLNYLGREVSEPDKWAELESVKFIEDGRLREDLNNERFSVEQVEKITAAIEDLKAHISSEFGLAKDKIEEVNSRLDYLEESVDRLGKFDWANATVGVLTSLVTGAIFSPDQAKNVWDFIWNALRGILQLPG